MHMFSSHRFRACLRAVTSSSPVGCILAMLPFSVAFGSLATLSFGPLHATPTDALVVGLVMLAGWDGWRARREKDRAERSSRCSITPHRMLILTLVALIAWMVLSLTWAADRVLAVKEMLKWSEALAVIIVAPRHLRDRRVLAAVLGTVVVAALVEALLGMVQGTVLAGDLPVSADRGVRVVGTFGQPNPYSGYLNLALPLLLALAAWARDLRLRLAGGGMALVLGGALALAQSRGALIGLGAALLVMAWFGWPSARRFLAGGMALCGCLIAMAVMSGSVALSTLLEELGLRPLTDAALSHNVTDANFSTVERLAHWAAAARMVAAHPLTGVGAGNYPVAYHLYAVPRWQLPLGHAHNLYLNMMAELGIIGGSLYLASVIAGLWLIMQLISVEEISYSPRPAILLGILGVTVAVAAHNMVDDLTTHGMLLEQTLLLACVQGLVLARLKQ